MLSRLALGDRTRNRRRTVADYGKDRERTVVSFMDDFGACIAHLRFPVTHRRAIRTTNLLERLFVEERRCFNIISNAFREQVGLKLMFRRAHACWQAVAFGQSY